MHTGNLLNFVADKIVLHINITFYSARNARIASPVLATTIPSVCLSIRLSATRRHYVKTAARSTVQFAPLDSKMCLVL